MPALYVKDPADAIDYLLDWSGWIRAGDEIATSVVTSSSSELVITSSTHTAASVTVWVAGGTLGKTYEIVNTITTTAGRTAERSIFVQVRNLLFE